MKAIIVTSTKHEYLRLWRRPDQTVYRERYPEHSHAICEGLEGFVLTNSGRTDPEALLEVAKLCDAELLVLKSTLWDIEGLSDAIEELKQHYLLLSYGYGDPVDESVYHLQASPRCQWSYWGLTLDELERYLGFALEEPSWEHSCVNYTENLLESKLFGTPIRVFRLMPLGLLRRDDQPTKIIHDGRMIYCADDKEEAVLSLMDILRVTQGRTKPLVFVDNSVCRVNYRTYMDTELKRMQRMFRAECGYEGLAVAGPTMRIQHDKLGPGAILAESHNDRCFRTTGCRYVGLGNYRSTFHFDDKELVYRYVEAQHDNS